MPGAFVFFETGGVDQSFEKVINCLLTASSPGRISWKRHSDSTRNAIMSKRTHYFTYHFQWHWTEGCLKNFYDRDPLRDGGSVDYRFGPLLVFKKIHWLR